MRIPTRDKNPPYRMKVAFFSSLFLSGLCEKQKYFPYLFWICVAMVTEEEALSEQGFEKIWERV